MGFKFNIFTGTLDIVGSSGSGGGVQGPPMSTDRGIARWNGTTGNLLEDSPYAIVQDGGTVQAQASTFQNTISNLVTVPDDGVAIMRNVILVSGGDIGLEGDAELILI
jgi:hypothetical protein